MFPRNHAARIHRLPIRRIEFLSDSFPVLRGFALSEFLAVRFPQVRTFRHFDHRWISSPVPIWMLHARQKPLCQVVMFSNRGHHDCREFLPEACEPAECFRDVFLAFLGHQWRLRGLWRLHVVENQ